MMGAVIELIIVLIGLAVTAILFYRFPKLPEEGMDDTDFPSVSVIIPARNEEKNLPLLLEDLRKQTVTPYEVICVDDASEDATAHIAASYDVNVISLRSKPEDWTGKSWACQNGADAASGTLLLFLDADVRMAPKGLRKLLMAFAQNGRTISVQPYHRPEKAYEQLSMFFNLIQIAANGIALPKPVNTGLFGPVILIRRADYDAAGGHQHIHDSIVEDMALGKRLRVKGIPFSLFIGDGDIRFRMYGCGIRRLVQGWLKNLGAGAVSIRPLVFLLVFFWVSSLISVPLHLIIFAVAGSLLYITIYCVLYAVWAVVLFFVSRRVGRFALWAVILYPLLITFFAAVFVVSLVKKIFRIDVKWKGRMVAHRKHT